ncbi:MAG: SH3 domain-containing protein [Gemmatimonadaceae bacterium]
MSTAPSGRRLARGLVLASVAVAALMAVGYAISRHAEPSQPASTPAVPPVDSAVRADSMPTRDSTPAAAADAGARQASALAPPPTGAAQTRTAAPAVVAASPSPRTAVPDAVNTAPMKPAPPPSVAVPDTGRWEYAVAITWVRVRSAPTRESEVLRMVDSAQRVRLGPPRSGWRPIRVGVDRGWVDPRFFAVVTTPKQP